MLSLNSNQLCGVDELRYSQLGVDELCDNDTDWPNWG